MNKIDTTCTNLDKIEVYNLAAMSHVKISFELPEYTANVDGLGTLRILDSILTLGMKDRVKFYQAGTSEMFGASKPPQNEKTNFYFSWMANARSILDENVQVFYVNGTKGSYSQNNDLKKELSLSTGLNYEYKFSKNNIFLMSLDGLQTSQDTSGIQANLNYNYKF